MSDEVSTSAPDPAPQAEPQYVYVAGYLSRPSLTRFEIVKETPKQYRINGSSGTCIFGTKGHGYTILHKANTSPSEFVSTDLLATYEWLHERAKEFTQEQRGKLARAEQSENEIGDMVTNLKYGAMPPVNEQ